MCVSVCVPIVRSTVHTSQYIAFVLWQVKWSKDRFKEIEQKLKPFLKQTGYKVCYMQCVCVCVFLP